MSPAVPPKHRYQENPDHIPRTTDMRGPLETTGLGVRADLDAWSPVFTAEAERKAAFVAKTRVEVVPAAEVGDQTLHTGTLETTGDAPTAPTVETPEESVGNGEPADGDQGEPQEPPAADVGTTVDTTDTDTATTPSVSAADAALAEASGDSGAGEPAGDAFDPSQHTVAEVIAYMQGASPEERARVVEAERAGKKRTTITGG